MCITNLDKNSRIAAYSTLLLFINISAVFCSASTYTLTIQAIFGYFDKSRGQT